MKPVVFYTIVALVTLLLIFLANNHVAIVVWK